MATTNVYKLMSAWAIVTAGNNNFHYVRWSSSNTATHECPICKKHKVGATYGWNCIGYAWAIWHHGGGLNSRCNCGVIPNEIGDKMLKASASNALAIAQKYSGLKTIKVIRNNKKAIPLSKLQEGDILLLFKGDTYYHTVYYMGNGKYTDSTLGRSDNIKADITMSSTMKSHIKIALRYTGNTAVVLKSLDVIAKEVIAGKWGSGDVRKKALIRAGYTYSKVQAKVNELLEEKAKPQKPYQNLKAANYISDVVYIGQATSDERGKTAGGVAGDQKSGEVAISKWSYSNKSTYNTWKHVFRAKDGAARLKIAQAAIDACNNNYIGYDTQQPDRKSCFKAAQKVNFDLSKVATNCELTCSELANVCIAAAGLKSYLPVTKQAYVESLKNTLINSSEFTHYTDTTYTAKSNKLLPGDIIMSDTHTAIIVKAPIIVAKKGYAGTFPSLTLKKSNAQVIADTIKWALWISNDNNFHYGYTSKDKKVNAHHNGCYFCGTNKSQKKGMLMPEHTYCCNPFVGAAWAHGGCVPEAIKLCQNNKSWSYDKGAGYDKSKLFTNLGHPAKSKLKAGDVLCMNTHIALYIGSGKIVQAGIGDDNKKNSAKWNKSISVATLTDSMYKKFLRVHRFNGSVNTTMNIKHGEVSQRVAQWQAFLDWYFNGKVGKADGYYGDNTLKWTKKFQEAEIGKGEGDGIIGPKTLEAAKKVKK